MKKTIILTLSLALNAIILATALFFNTVLGAFGYAMTSVGVLQNLKNSQLVTERMKTRHEQKKTRTTKTFAKRAGKRVASTALAAATIGTVAVVTTMTYLEVSDYCEEKKDLQLEANILYQTEVKFDFDRCIEEGKEDSKNILIELKDSSTEKVSSAFTSTTKYSAKKWAAIQDASFQALQSTTDGAGGLWNSIRSWVVE